jgi:hypothetical protein
MTMATTIKMIFSAELPPWEAIAAGAIGAGGDTTGAGVAAMLGSAVAPGMTAPHFEQNLTPGAIGDPQFPQNPATNHLRCTAVQGSSRASRKSGTSNQSRTKVK